MMDDLAYSLRYKWRSLANIQSLALGGKYGNQQYITRPFQKLMQNSCRRNFKLGMSTTCQLQKRTCKKSWLQY